MDACTTCATRGIRVLGMWFSFEQIADLLLSATLRVPAFWAAEQQITT